MNGSIDILREIIYHHHDGPTHDYLCLHVNVIVEFSKYTIHIDKTYFLDMPSTWVHILSVTERCKGNCCNVSIIIFRVCIVIMIHKSQGMIILVLSTYLNM